MQRYQRISAYVTLINYRSIRIYTNLVTLIAWMTMVFTMLELLQQWRKKIIKDVCIIGSDYGSLLHNEISSSGLKSILVRTKWDITGTLQNGFHRSSYVPKLPFPEITSEELDMLSEIYSIPRNLLEISFEKLLSRSELLPRDQHFNEFTGAVLNCYLPKKLDLTSDSNYRGNVLDVTPLDGCNKISLDTGESFYAKYVIIVEAVDLTLLEKLHHFDSPLLGTLCLEYVTIREEAVEANEEANAAETKEETKEEANAPVCTGAFGIGKDSCVMHYNDAGISTTRLTTLTKQGLAYTPKGYTSIEVDKRGLLNHVFLMPKQVPRGVCVIDTLNMPTRCPWRDVIVLAYATAEILTGAL